MGAQQSQEARHEQGPETAHPGVSENDSFVVQNAPLTPNSTSSSYPSILGGFGGSQNIDGRTPETAIIIDWDSEEDPSNLLRQCQKRNKIPENGSDSDEEFVTLLRRHRKGNNIENVSKVIRQDNWESLDIDWWNNLSIHKIKTRKTKRHVSSSKNQRDKRPIDVEHRNNVKRPKPRTQSFLPNGRRENTTLSFSHPLVPSSGKNRKRPCSHDREYRLSAYNTDSLIESHRPTKKIRTLPKVAGILTIPSDNQTRHSEAWGGKHRFSIQNDEYNSADFQPNEKNGTSSFQVNRSPRFYSNESSASKSLKGDGAIANISSSRSNGVNDQITKRRTKSSHTARKSKLARFRRADRSCEVRPETVSEPCTPEEPQKGRYITARVDSGEILQDTRPPQAGKSINRSHNINQRLRHPNQPSPPRTQSEERDTALIQRFESQKRPPEYVVPKYKWRYTIKYVDSADIILDDEDMKKKTKTERSFADREKANKYLDHMTSPDTVGGLDAIASRTTTLEGQERLLKVDITLTNGEHYLQWVERDWVVLGDLKWEESRQRQWQPTTRPKIPHYVVECDLISYETSLVTRCEDDEDDTTSLDDRDSSLGSLGMNIQLTAEKLDRITFTIREKANYEAGKLFLEKTKVDKRFAQPSDVLWWEQNALPEHRKAMSDACRPDGLYELAMDAHDMNSRLGWDQITVRVHEVDDMTGPVNF